MSNPNTPIIQFGKATKREARLRLALFGPSGSGKTYTALAIATALGQKVAVLDTEHGSASKYAGEFNFDTATLASFHPKNYIAAIKTAEQAGYDVLILDSLSHAWMGKDGALELVDRAAKSSRAGNSYTAWADVTPLHNQLIEAIVGSKIHIIATMRAKTDYVLEQGSNGKTSPKKVGLAAIQRDGMEYEFDVVGRLDPDNNLAIEKTRCPALAGKVYYQAGADIAGELQAWLSDGAPIEFKQKMIDKIAALWAQERELGHEFTEGNEAALASVLKSQQEEQAQDLAALSEQELTTIGLSVRARVEELHSQLTKREETAPAA